MSAPSLKLVEKTALPVAAVPAEASPAAAAPALSASGRIDPVSLRLFVAVLDTGTIAAAAEREHIAPSAVSKRLSDLEYTVRTRLLDRSNRGIEPTPAGRELLSLARSVLNQLDNVVHRLREHSDGVRGLVRVFANLSAISEFMPACLQSFMAQHPHVQVQLQERVSSAVQQGVAANAADVGLYAHGGSDGAPVDGLVSLPFQRDELVLVVPVGHPLTQAAPPGIAQALEHDFVGLHDGSAINQELMRAAQTCGQALRCRIQVPSYDALSLMVAAGMGIAVMPRLVAERYQQLDRIRMLALHEPWARREIRICVRSLDSLAPAARLFVEHLRAPAASPAVMAASRTDALPPRPLPRIMPRLEEQATGGACATWSPSQRRGE